METLLAQIAAALLARKQTLATAESCTGGLVGAALTSLPGSSTWYLGGIVAYANALKIRLLGVAPELLETCGAVSLETARAMAEGARAATGADFAVSITGIAGPDGGTQEKPVGLGTILENWICLRREAVRAGVATCASMDWRREVLGLGFSALGLRACSDETL